MISNTHDLGKLVKQSLTVFYEKDKKSFSATLSPGKYLFECWGAEGSHNLTEGGKGAYCSGEILISRSLTFYLFPGESGKTYGDHTFNGGGSGKFNASNEIWSNIEGIAKCGSGGGASDIRLIDGDWNDTRSLKSRIIVAAGGGGYVNYNAGNGDNEVPGSSGGNLTSLNGSYSQCIQCDSSEATEIKLAEGATQSKGGISVTSQGGLGYGGDSENNIGGGGGGGYFGGAGGSHAFHRYGSGSGGSSFISGYPGCHAFPSPTSEETSPTQNIHYSGLYFTNSQMKSGDYSFLSPSGTTENGHSGVGYIRITAIYLLIQTKYSSIWKAPLSFLFISIYK